MKLPRVPVADNIPGGEMPKFRNLWEQIRPQMPKRAAARRAGSTSKLVHDFIAGFTPARTRTAPRLRRGARQELPRRDAS